MGASSSTEAVSKEQREVESQAASTGALPLLQKSFSNLADPLSNSIPLSSLQDCFSLKYTNMSCEGGAELPDCFPGLLDQMGTSIFDTLFAPEKGGITWIEFVRGYIRCCGRMSASSLLNILFRVLALAAERGGCPLNLNFDSNEVDSKISGSILPKDLGVVLWVCWILSWNSRKFKQATESNVANLPDLNPLVLSAVVSCNDKDIDIDVWDSDVFKLNVGLNVGKIHMWVLRTVPNLADCFSQFINARLKSVAAPEQPLGAGTSNMSAEGTSSTKAHLLTCGRAWALSLSQRSRISEEILRICFPCNDNVIEDSLLYRSYVHGKGMNRFWSSVEGYHGPLLLVISASSGKSSESSRKWIIGALTQQGLENRDVFYGSGGCLYSTYPVFQVFSSSGKEHNYVYSHVHSAVRVYERNPKPAGIGFGGSISTERIFIDEDFAKVTIRHHAVDKTYQPGSLFPNQGFLPVEASILEVELWGLGGKAAKEVQISYKQREELFTEQRRKVDLKAFGNWEDSPEKMMMDMTSNPNSVRREER